tara:strand:- start:376 stop:1530 length:1155 start_codon:yes stop_codon:yes gene_type:complete
MASEKRHNGGGTGPFTFDFPSLEQSDIKVSVGNAEVTSGFSINNYDPVTGGDVTFTSNTASGTNNVRIYRQTEPETLAATFVAGSSISANDLNNCNKQTIFLADENRTSINSLALGNAGSAIVISGTNIADNSISSSKIVDLEVKTADINNLAVTTGKLADTAVTTAKIDAAAVTTAKIANTNITTAKIADGAVTQTKINSAVIFTPVGTVITYAGSTAPAGYLKANGDSIPNGSGTVQSVTADFSALYAVVGATLPDLRGEFIRGLDDSRGVDSGRQIRSAQADENKQHNHSISVSGTTSNKSLTGGIRKISEGFNANGSASGVFTKTQDGNSSITGSSSNSPVGGVNFDGSHDHTFSASGTSGNQGSESRPRNVALLMCIKY